MIFKNLISLIVVTCCTISIVNGTAYTGPIIAEGVDLIKSFEQFEPNFYIDPVGIRTIGYGYSCSANPCDNIKPPLSEPQAAALLETQLRTFESCISNNVEYDQLNAQQFSALVSFAFNVGCNAFKKSTLLRKLNRNDVEDAANEFARWNKGGGKVLNGLTRRRAAERLLFCKDNVC
ncbi:hypothetical protein HA402_010489 [Bradysia odoriphaga]|nr:hypothetical protein HA402_010489 [Bradysia odoriphaga]